MHTRADPVGEGTGEPDPRGMRVGELAPLVAACKKPLKISIGSELKSISLRTKFSCTRRFYESCQGKESIRVSSKLVVLSICGDNDQHGAIYKRGLYCMMARCQSLAYVL